MNSSSSFATVINGGESRCWHVTCTKKNTHTKSVCTFAETLRGHVRKEWHEVLLVRCGLRLFGGETSVAARVFCLRCFFMCIIYTAENVQPLGVHQDYIQSFDRVWTFSFQ